MSISSKILFSLADSDVNVEELNLPEQEILVQSVCETMVPKLVAEDIPLLFSLLSDVFPGIKYSRAEMDDLKKHIRKVCQDQFRPSPRLLQH